MRLNPLHLSQMTSDQMRLLQCMEQLSKSHDIIPIDLISAYYKRPVYNELKQLMVWRLITYENSNKTCGYRLGYGGFDYMALYTLNKRGLLGIGKQLGVGKESDVYLGKMVVNEDSFDMDDGVDVVVKIHRLGRTSFRTVKNNRDYLEGKGHTSWLEMSRISAQKEYEFMSILQGKFPVPQPISHNRHVVVMSPINGFPLTQITEYGNAQIVYQQMKSMVILLAQYGLIHGDLNVFNFMITEDEKVHLIDFPQMVSTSHIEADMYYNRDIQGVVDFGMKWKCEIGDFPDLKDIEVIEALDVAVKASGYIKQPKIKVKKVKDEDVNKICIRTAKLNFKDKQERIIWKKGNNSKSKNKVNRSEYSSYRDLA
eukprot:NODE_59_length_25653_cov_0.289622.p8 type:complete len:369 gc:universal NODE_59_length_25653_cov_0.289622:15250-16356(+)